MLDYRLFVFRTVAEKLNFTRAARELHISQPSVSQHVKLLEEHFGIALFRRSGAGITLTEEGHLLLAHAQRIADLERATEQAIRSAAGGLTGEIRCGASTTVGQYFLPALIGEFHAKHSGIQVKLNVGNTEEIVGALLASKIDVGFIEGPCGRTDITTGKFFDDELLCVAAPSHPLAQLKNVSKTDLASAKFIMREQGSGTREITERALKRYGVSAKELNVLIELKYSESIKGVLETGIGIGFLSKLVVRKELAAGSLCVIPVKKLRVSRAFYFIYPRGPRLTGPAGAFLDFVTEP